MKFDLIYYFFDLLNNKEKEKIKQEINNININANNYYDLDEEYNISDLFNEEMINNSSSYKALYLCYNEMTKKNILDIEKIEKKEEINCDQSFILFLYYISKKVNKDFCKINLIILKHFRDLINILGWNLLSRFISINDEDTSKDFCSIKEPLKIPLLANDFCNNYVKKVWKEFDIYFVFVIISHFNFWLYANNLNFIQLNLPNVLKDKEKLIKNENESINEDIDSKKENKI